MIQGKDLHNRMETFPEPKGADVVREELKRMKTKRGPEEEDGLAERLAAARELQPPDNACRACFKAGRDAAATALSGDAPLVDRIAAARAVQSKHYHAGDRSFQVGRDAAIAAVTDQ